MRPGSLASRMTPAQGGRASLPAPLRALTLGSESQNERLLLHDDRVSAHTDGVRDPGIAVGMVEVAGAALVLDPLDVVGVHSGKGTSLTIAGGTGDELVLIRAADRLHTDPQSVVLVDTIVRRKRLLTIRNSLKWIRLLSSWICFHAPPRSAIGSTDAIAGAELVDTPVRRRIRGLGVRVVLPHGGIAPNYVRERVEGKSGAGVDDQARPLPAVRDRDVAVHALSRPGVAVEVGLAVSGVGPTDATGVDIAGDRIRGHGGAGNLPVLERRRPFVHHPYVEVLEIMALRADDRMVLAVEVDGVVGRRHAREVRIARGLPA